MENINLAEEQSASQRCHLCQCADSFGYGRCDILPQLSGGAGGQTGSLQFHSVDQMMGETGKNILISVIKSSSVQIYN